MKTWSSALFPLTLLAALVALTFWLRYATELPAVKHDGKNRHDPDYIVTDATLRKINENGQLEYTLKASDLRHYPDNDTTDTLQPDLLFLSPTAPSLTLTADRGQISQDGKQVDLYDNVKVIRAPYEKYAELVAQTSKLTVLPDDERAFTESPVHITQGASWVKGVGLQINNKVRTYEIKSHVVAELDSKLTKKKTP